MAEHDPLPFGVRVVDDEGIRCHVCGKAFGHLSTHVTRTHGFASTHEYRETFGLSRRGLVGPRTLEKYRRNAETSNLVEAGIPSRVRKPRPHPRISPEGRSEGNANLKRGYLPSLEKKHQERRSQTHCKHGHELTGDNVRIVNGARRCLPCARDQARARRSQMRPK